MHFDRNFTVETRISMFIQKYEGTLIRMMGSSSICAHSLFTSRKSTFVKNFNNAHGILWQISLFDVGVNLKYTLGKLMSTLMPRHLQKTMDRVSCRLRDAVRLRRYIPRPLP